MQMALYINAQNKFSFMLAIVAFASFTSPLTPRRSFFTSTISPAPLAMSEPEFIAMPTLASLSDGESFMPSPTKITPPRLMSSFTLLNLSSGSIFA